VSRRRVTLISVVSGVSVAGVALGVAALVVVLSVMNGFYDTVRDLLVSYDPHVRIEAADGQPLAAPESLLAVARRTPHVVTAAPLAGGKALLTSPDAGAPGRVVTVRGVDPAALDSTVARAVTAGVFDVGRAAGGPGIVIGHALATQLALFPGAAPGDGLGGAVGLAGSRISLRSAPAPERTAAPYPPGLPPPPVVVLRRTLELGPADDAGH